MRHWERCWCRAEEEVKVGTVALLFVWRPSERILEGIRVARPDIRGWGRRRQEGGRHCGACEIREVGWPLKARVEAGGLWPGWHSDIVWMGLGTGGDMRIIGESICEGREGRGRGCGR